jgi:hypothetical protein
MPEEELPGRPASSPTAGGLRDIVRTFVAFGVAFTFVKIGGAVPGVDMAGMQEAVIVIIVSAVMAFAGKAFRGAGIGVGKVM